MQLGFSFFFKKKQTKKVIEVLLKTKANVWLKDYGYSLTLSNF